MLDRVLNIGVALSGRVGSGRFYWTKMTGKFMGNGMEGKLAKLAETKKHFILDCDGVLWHSSELIEGSLDAVRRLKQSGCDVVFVTNNATRSRATYVDKFHGLGFDMVTQEHINTSGSAAAEYCQKNGFDKVFAIGEQGVVDELGLHGIQVVRDDGGDEMSDEQFIATVIEDGVKAVVVGWDRTFSYRKLCLGSLYLQAGAKLVACNPDSGDKVGGRFMPGNGCNVAALQYSVEDPLGKNTVITGKPNRTFMEQILEKYAFDPSKTVMVGDRLDTDIQFGGDLVETLLVLSGCCKEEQIGELPEHMKKPTYVAADLATAMENARVV